MIVLSQMLAADRVVVLRETEKDAVLQGLTSVLSRSPLVHDEAELLEAIRQRELIMSTGIGFGLAVPHAKIASVDDVVMAVGVSHQGVAYGSLDDQPVHIVVMIAAGAEQQDKYVRTLARVMLVLKNPKTRDRIAAATCPEELFDVFRQF